MNRNRGGFENKRVMGCFFCSVAIPPGTPVTTASRFPTRSLSSVVAAVSAAPSRARYRRPARNATHSVAGGARRLLQLRASPCAPSSVVAAVSAASSRVRYRRHQPTPRLRLAGAGYYSSALPSYFLFLIMCLNFRTAKFNSIEVSESLVFKSSSKMPEINSPLFCMSTFWADLS